ncbi:MAG: hypothetical protein ACFE8C_14160 [Promethearchaeota archaeon]
MSDEDKEILIESPRILVTQFIPMGKNNMISINRHIGAHKKYGTPTEFGMKGAVKNIKKGNFQMEKSGVFLTTVDYSFSGHINTHLKTSLYADDIIGLNLDKDGFSSLGISIPGKNLTTDEIKILIGKLSYRSVDYVYAILTDVQQALLGTLYGVSDIMNSHFAISTYSLINAESFGEGIDFSNTADFISKYPRKVDAITDWIIDHGTVDGCHIFIGMRATVCIGIPSKNLRIALKNMLFLKSCFNTSLRLFSIIWSLSKQVKKINDAIPNSNYRELKRFSLDISEINNLISRIRVLDQMIDVAIEKKKNEWESYDFREQIPQFFRIEEEFEDEIDKSNDRDLILEQIAVDIEALREGIEQRMDLIMTKNSEFLNVVLLILTLISVIGIADLLGLDILQWSIVVLAMIPFLYASIIYLRNYIRNFK